MRGFWAPPQPHLPCIRLKASAQARTTTDRCTETPCAAATACQRGRTEAPRHEAVAAAAASASAVGQQPASDASVSSGARLNGLSAQSSLARGQQAAWWLCGHADMRPCGHVAMWPCGHAAMCLAQAGACGGRGTCGFKQCGTCFCSTQLSTVQRCMHACCAASHPPAMARCVCQPASRSTCMYVGWHHACQHV